jgi:Ca2+-binding RTX toxin-like protein
MFGSTAGATPLKLELLESREVPAATTVLQGPNLVITGDNKADVVLITEAGGQLLVTVNGEAQAPIPVAAVQMITFDGAGGDDIFVNMSSVFSVALGGQGKDMLFGGTGGNVLFGGQGKDVLIGGIGNDIIAGENGNDVLLGGPGNDILLGGTGRDQFLDHDTANDVFDDRVNDFFDASEDGDDGGGNGNGKDKDKK